MKKYRQLKVLSKFRARRWDDVFVPEIRLIGKWLEELGFEQGKKVTVEQKKDKLIITLNNEEKEE